MIEKLIKSPKNIRIKESINLRKSKNRRQQKKFLVEGTREIKQALDNDFHLLEIFISNDTLSKEAVKLLSHPKIAASERIRVSQEAFSRLAMRVDVDGLVAVFTAKDHMLSTVTLSQHPLVLIIDGVEKPGNLGAILRTAAACSVDLVVVVSNNKDLFHPHIIRNSLGTVFSLPIVFCSQKDCLSYLKKKKIIIHLSALTKNSIDYLQGHWQGPCAIILGSEAKGADSFWFKNSHQMTAIPMSGQVDSLNVSVACGVFLYEIKRQRRSRINLQ